MILLVIQYNAFIKISYIYIMMIPKIIHQIWIGPNPEPIKWTNTIKNDYLKAYPHYEYKL